MKTTKRKGKGRNCLQGKYEVKNKSKYVGKKDPRYLSSYELHVFRYLDYHPSVVEWGSETHIVKYWDDRVQRKRRYMVDIYMKVKKRNGNLVTYLAEIKPYAQTLEPKKTKRKRQDVYDDEISTFITNQLKWQAAKKYCEARDWQWMILTEYQIFKK